MRLEKAAQPTGSASTEESARPALQSQSVHAAKAINKITFPRVVPRAQR
jgi:hypothetical protein